MGIWDRLTIACALSFCLLVAGLSVGIVLGELRAEVDVGEDVAVEHEEAVGEELLGERLSDVVLHTALETLLGRPVPEAGRTGIRHGAAIVGEQLHLTYGPVDLNDPQNEVVVRGNITEVLIPTPGWE